MLGLIGPSTTPCAIALLPKVEAAEIPAIHWAGTDQACGNWQFQFQAGYFLDEGPALARLLARRGHGRAVCFRGEGAYGEAYLAPFLEAAAQLGIAITGELAVPVTATNLDSEVDIAHSSGAQALVAMGLFSVGVTLAALIWRGSCSKASAWRRISPAPDCAAAWSRCTILQPRPAAPELAWALARRIGSPSRGLDCSYSARSPKRVCGFIRLDPK